MQWSIYYFCKKSILDVWQGFEYSCTIYYAYCSYLTDENKFLKYLTVIHTFYL